VRCRRRSGAVGVAGAAGSPRHHAQISKIGRDGGGGRDRRPARRRRRMSPSHLGGRTCRRRAVSTARRGRCAAPAPRASSVDARRRPRASPVPSSSGPCRISTPPGGAAPGGCGWPGRWPGPRGRAAPHRCRPGPAAPAPPGDSAGEVEPVLVEGVGVGATLFQAHRGRAQEPGRRHGQGRPAAHPQRVDERGGEPVRPGRRRAVDADPQVPAGFPGNQQVSKALGETFGG
jgi:hypothetical protein